MLITWLLYTMTLEIAGFSASTHAIIYPQSLHLTPCIMGKLRQAIGPSHAFGSASKLLSSHERRPEQLAPTVLKRRKGSLSSGGVIWSARFHSTPPPAFMNFSTSSLPIEVSFAGKV